MILVINVCKNNLHYGEFVRPVADIIKDNYKVKHFSELKKEDINKADKIIICGTSLKDNEFMNHFGKFQWIKDFNKPLLGICAGMQIIGNIFDAESVECNEIGVHRIKCKKKYLTDKNELEVYELHNFSITLPKGFIELGKNKNCLQMIKRDNIYGVMFHPEVLNKDIIENFVKKKKIEKFHQTKNQ